MKQLKLLIQTTCVLFFLAGFSRCTKVLDQVPEDRIDIENYFKNREDAEAALNGCYQIVFADLAPAYHLNNMLSARELEGVDDVTARPIQYRPALRVDNDGGTGSIWVNSYRAIARINLLLEKLPGIPVGFFNEQNVPATRERKKEIEGEAKFLRAWIYYNLAYNWGDVPLVTSFPTSGSPAANQLARTPVAQVWQQVLTDLTEAENLLPLNHNFFRANLSAANQRILTKGKATKGMARLMLARMALKDKQWQRAAEKAQEIIGSGQYTLTPNYASIFINTPTGSSQNSSESILEIQAVSGGFNNTGGLFAWEFVGPGRTKLTDTLRKTFRDMLNIEDAYDLRLLYSSNYAYNTDRSLRGVSMVKYFNRDGASPFSSADPFNYVLGRLSEAYLIRAEALNELAFGNNEALTLVNALRARAQNSAANNYPVVVRRPGRPDTTVSAKGIPAASFTTGANVETVNSQAAFRKLIRDEWQRELVFEGHQWYNILRWDAQDNTRNALWYLYLNTSLPGANAGKVLLPVPQSEVLVNTALTQNTGY